MILVADGSHHVTVDVARLKANDISGLMWKGTQGASFVDGTREGVEATCALHDMPFIQMHYQDAGSSVEDEFANIVRNHSTLLPLVLDVETGSGALYRTRDLLARCIRAGYHVPFLYLPKWYWEKVGKPDLTGLPPLWASHYVPGAGNPSTLYKSVVASWWDGYGGNNPLLLQFTSSGRLGGMTLGDFSLFMGDSAQFRRFLNPHNFDYTTPHEEYEMMTVPAGDQNWPLAIPSTKNVSLCVAPGDAPVYIDHIYTWGESGGTGYDAHADIEVQSGKAFQLPKGTIKADLFYRSEDKFGVTLDIL